jgi:REP element-mobilizing transposase RayT
MAGDFAPIFYRRRLPHFQPSPGSVFITWRLFGSPPPPPSSGRIGLDFVRHDRRLDTAQRGPFWLSIPSIAQLVQDAVLFAAQYQKRYALAAWVIMPNHIHLLLTPLASLRTITQGLKGYTARRANQLLDRHHPAFWQDESFDHWIRDEYEFQRVVHYIEQNPVKAGLARSAEDWFWSSIHAQ